MHDSFLGLNQSLDLGLSLRGMSLNYVKKCRAKDNHILMSRYSTKFKRWFYQDHIQSHFRQYRNIWLSIMIWDGGKELMNIYNGDFSTAALTAFGTASLGAVIKTFFQVVLPEVFPAKTTSAGQGSVSVSMTKGIDSVIVKKVK